MLWLIACSTLLLAVAVFMPSSSGPWRRRMLELTALLVTLLPLLRMGLEFTGIATSPLRQVVPVAAAGAILPAVGQIALELWIGGVIAFSLLGLRSWLRVRGLASRAEKLPATTTGRIAALLGLPRQTVQTHIRLSAEVTTPVVLPTSPGLILLPTGWSLWPERLQTSALRHEWHHLRHRDALWSCCMRAFCIVFWFHPLAWCLASRWSEECEHLADRAAVAGGDPADYAQDLLGLAAGRGAQALSGLTGFLGPRGSRLHRRVQALLIASGETGPSGTSMRAVIVVMLLLAGNCAWIGVRERNLTTLAGPLASEIRLRLTADAFPADQ